MYCNLPTNNSYLTTNNAYTNNYNLTQFNRFTNVNQNYYNIENGGVSVDTDITINNYNYGTRPYTGYIKRNGYKGIGNFLCGYRKPVQQGCGCASVKPKDQKVLQHNHQHLFEIR